MEDNRIITEGLEYLVYRFQGSNGLWRLVGTESKATLPDTLDTFKNEKGQFLQTTREKVYKMQQKGVITRFKEDIIEKRVLHNKKGNEAQNKLF